MFLLVIFALSTASLQDASVIEAQSLISVAKNNPQAFVEMFKGTPKDKLDTIINLLGALIHTAEKEIYDALKEKESLCKKINYDWCFGLGCGKEENLHYSILAKIEAAKGKLEECSKAYRTAEPQVNDEVALLEKIIGVLQSLKDPRSLADISNAQNFLSKENTAKSMLSMISDANADPKLVQEVIEMLGSLISDAKGELATFRKCIMESERNHQVYTFQLAEAELDLDHCREGVRRCNEQLQSMIASCRVADDNYKFISRYNNEEISTLASIIDILHNLGN